MSEEPKQIVVHPVLWEEIEAWAAGRGLLLMRIPTSEDELETYIFSPKDSSVYMFGKDAKTL